MKCPKCGSKNVINEYTDIIYGIVDLKCFDCKHEFIRKIGED